MKLLRLIIQHGSRGTLVASIVFGALGGALSTGLLLLIDKALLGGPEWSGTRMAIVFALLIPVASGTRFLAAYTLMKLGARAACDLQVQLTSRILAAPLRRLESLGSHRLLAALTDDVLSLTEALSNVPVFIVNLFMCVTCLAYLGWLSWPLLLLVIAFLGLAALTYQMPLSFGVRLQAQARERQDDLFERFRSATQGTKELKMKRGRRRAFMASVRQAAIALRDSRLASLRIFVAAAVWGGMLFFVVLGLIAYAVPVWLEDIDRQVLVSYGLVLLFLLGPVQMVLNLVPILTRAGVAIRKVENLGLSLAEAAEAEDAKPLAEPSGWRSLELRGVSHSYRRENEDGEFALGPMDLRFEPGELVFVVGGNGSGKTTLAKLILGLYPPEHGAVLLDGEPVTDTGRDAYRQLFSAVFSDFFLFEELLGMEASDLDVQARRYIETLRLDRKVSVEGGRLSTVDLSQGQRKRLALLTAYLEDSPIFLFDEWAADQDPEFKEVFYGQMLPSLKARGKLVLAITHDDRYFPLADRILKLDYGQLVLDAPTAQAGVGLSAQPA